LRVANALLADYAAQTSDGKLIVAGIFDVLFPLGGLPFRHAHMALALRIHIHPGEALKHGIRIKLVDPDGRDVLPEIGGEFVVPEVDPVAGATAQFVLDMDNVEFKTAGRHSFDVFVDGRYEESVPLAIAAGPPPSFHGVDG
jgi:hypothetical protein